MNRFYTVPYTYYYIHVTKNTHTCTTHKHTNKHSHPHTHTHTHTFILPFWLFFCVKCVGYKRGWNRNLETLRELGVYRVGYWPYVKALWPDCVRDIRCISLFITRMKQLWGRLMWINLKHFRLYKICI